MLKKLGIGFLAIFLTAVATVALQPSHFSVSRSAVIPSPPGAVFAVLDGFEHFPDWSPWDERDPAMRRDLSGPPAGTGASYHWSGNDDVGEGRMTIVETVPNEKIAVRLEFLRPFPAVNRTEYTLRPEGDGTRLTWTMSGDLGFLGKAFGMVKSHDQLIGPDFEKGLAKLAPVVEHVAIEARATTYEALLSPDICQCAQEELKCSEPRLLQGAQESWGRP
ncbi:MAG: SRPBCC family protein [Myxococcales bacterium]